MMIALQNSIKSNETTFEKVLLEYAPLIVAIVGIITLLFGLYQYRKSIIQNRSSIFLDMRNRYMGDVEFQNIFNLLENNSTELTNIPYKIKLRLLGFYEELAILVNSKLIRKEVAFYMFAYHALRIWDSDNFWILKDENGEDDGNIDKEAIYWSLFKDFVFQMKAMENKFQFKRNYFKV
jgi:hypothetical protein